MNPVPPIEAFPISSLLDNRGSVAAIPLFAHQGGWDEALLVGLPLAVIGLLLWVANRRVSAQLAAAAKTAAHRPGDGEPTGDTPDAR